MEQIISGGIKIGESSYPYSFDNKTEMITVYIGNRSVSLPEGIDTFVAKKYEMLTGGKTLYKLCFPLSNIVIGAAFAFAVSRNKSNG